ncbi:MAG: diaminopimelate decarboxylase [Mycobacteriales bacterium]
MRAHPAGPLHADLVRASPAMPAEADLNALHPQLWPRSAVRVDGVLMLGGVDVRDLAAKHGTPAFILDEDDFRSRCHDYRAAFGQGADVYYAGKAFLCAEVARWVRDEGLRLDVCSGGELALALRAGFPPERIAFHGNNKTSAELSAALDADVGRIVVDSYEEITRLADIAVRTGQRPKVQIRATVGVEAHTHEYIATAHEDQKFGFSMTAGAVLEAVRRIRMLPLLDLLGLHSHIGSQIFDTAGFEVSAHRVVELLAAVRDEHGIELPEIGLGGGLGIAYTAQDDPLDPRQVADSLREIVARECAAVGLAVPRLSVEPGRAIAGPGTVTLYEVGTVKNVDGIRTYISVGGGMSDNIRTALYDAEYTCALVSRASPARPMLTRIVGSHCESGDVVVRDAWLPSDIVPGDLIAVAATGAYCRSMASNYNVVGRPPVVAVRGGVSREVVRRETIDDLLRLDVG